MRVDSQTLADIELYSRFSNISSIFKTYNKTATQGGSNWLYRLLHNPVSDYQFLEERKKEIEFIARSNIRIKIDKRQIDYIEFYRKIDRFPLRSNWIDAYKDGIQNKFNPDGDYYTIREGVYRLLMLFSKLSEFLDELNESVGPESLHSKFECFQAFIKHRSVARLLAHMPKESTKIEWVELGRLDTLFRRKKKGQLQDVLDAVYALDVIQCLADVLNQKGYSMPQYSTDDAPVFELEGGFHPFLETPVKNDFSFAHKSNLCFLSGPNMSGKSTFLKTVGLLVYLSHIGFPVPAKRFVTSIYTELFTTINLSDNLNLGFSHFYSEVKRVKDMALALNSQGRMFVIFDELFKGTNVKDAFDSTLMVVRALSKIKNSIFFISSHILEVAEEIQGKECVDFRCFESVLENEEARYDYKLKKGVTKERIGYQIVKQEMIESILNEVIKKQT